jgi:hypothetical protein
MHPAPELTRLFGMAVITSLLLCAGCGDDAGSFPLFVEPTEVAVAPQDFLGEVSCSSNEGAMRSYVVTLSGWADSTDTSPFVVGSSLPVPCSMVAGFRDSVVIGGVYTAEIDAYAVGPDQVQPFGGLSSGSRQMRRIDTDEPLAPRWTTRCGSGADSGVMAVTNQRRFVRPCEDLVDAEPSATSLSLPPARVLGDDPCSIAASIDASEDSGLLPAVSGLACDADAPVFDAVAGRRYVIYATAIDADGKQLGSECTATGIEGQTVTPQCQELTSQGSARMALAGITLNDMPVCPAGLFYDVALDGETLNSVPLPCDVATDIGPFEAGIYPLDITVYNSIGATFGSGADCAADVRPGRTGDAFCVALP